jgi:hypothetical protein
MENKEPMAGEKDGQREMLRHSVATLAYRSAKALRGAPASFSEFPAGAGPRTVGKILAHMGDLMDWALSMANGTKEWKDTPVGAWDADVHRYFAGVKAFDDYLASDATLQSSADRLFQGPVADAIAHTGQLNMLRRMAGVPIKSENYFKAPVAIGSVGLEQAPPKFEFD